MKRLLVAQAKARCAVYKEFAGRATRMATGPELGEIGKLAMHASSVVLDGLWRAEEAALRALDNES